MAPADGGGPGWGTEGGVEVEGTVVSLFLYALEVFRKPQGKTIVAEGWREGYATDS